MTVFPGGPQDGVKYVMTAPDGNRCAFNDPTDADYVGMAWFTGLDSPDIREALDLRTASDGAIQGLNFRGARAVVGNVEIIATSTTDRNTKFQKLKRAMNALRADGTLDFTPDGGIASRIYFRQNGPIRRADERGWKYTVQFPMMAADPSIYSQGLRSSSGTTAPVVLTNQGDYNTAPTFQVVSGTSSGVLIKVANQTTGQSFQLLTTFPPATYGATWGAAWGGSGTGNGQFANAYGTAVDSTGNVFVTDSGNNRVQKFNSSGIYQSQFGTGGTGNGQFNSPTGIAIDSTNNIFVVDSGNNRIQKFNSAGVYQSQFGSVGAATGLFQSPVYGIAIDSSNNMFVADAGNFRIQKFNSAGVFQATVSSNPVGLACDAAGNVYAACGGSTPPIRKYTNALVASTTYGAAGTGDGQFQNAYGIAIDGSGNMFVVDSQRNDVQKLNSSGVFQGKFGSYGSSGGQFNYPALMSFNAAKTHLYVPSVFGNRVDDWAITNSATITFNTAVASVFAGGSNVYKYFDVTGSQWWSMAPGDNTILVTGAASWSATWRDAWL